ncbi:MAG: nucleotidyltransferase [Bacilli bacterium]|nr:nucleotidyltransferase [Bacilli bacterium]
MNLVVMAAGMGSRFGGLKQLTPVGPSGEFLIDYSIYDAILAGVEKVIFVIKEEHQELFHETIGKRISSKIKVEYAFQKLDDLPITPTKEITRTKPWGTGHALLTSATYVDSNFMIINADDFYGRDAFLTMGHFLKENASIDGAKKHYALVGYHLKNTLSQNGTVSRGICETENGYLKKVTERTKIGYNQNNELVYFENDTQTPIDENILVSTNLFGFTKEIFIDAKKYFEEFLMIEDNLNTKEFYLPTVVQKSIDDDLADVKILSTTSKFNGMTYKEDLEGLKEYINELVKNGIYPSNLWEEKTDEK